MFSSSHSDSTQACWKGRDIDPIRHTDSDRPVQQELVHTHIVVLVDTYLINLNMVVEEVHSFHTHT